MNKIKVFFAGLFFGIVGILALVFRSRKIQEAESEKDRAQNKLEKLESRRELEKKFEGRSDSDIVLDAIDEQLRKGSDS